MDGQWQKQNSDVRAGLDLGIASPTDYNQMLQELGDDLDGVLGLGANTNAGYTGHASAEAGEQDDYGSPRRRRWLRRRHNRDQIHGLEVLFRETPHPDENQRADLGRRLGITEAQVKFWFQNRRSSQKTQEARQAINKLKEVNAELQAERRALKSAAEKKRCLACRPPTAGSGESQQQLASENARLKGKLQHATAYLNRVTGGRASELIATAMPSAGSHGPATTNHNDGKGKAVAADHAPPSHCAPMMPANGRSPCDTHDMLVDIAKRATHEFRTVVYGDATMWTQAPDGGLVEVLNFQNYIDTIFPKSTFGPYGLGVVVDGTRKTGDVRGTAENLVGVLMDAADWSGMFPGIVASARASPVLIPVGSRHGMTILMEADLRVLSPQVPVRRIKFVRQCRRVGPGNTWAVVDVSVGGILGQDAATCRLLPSGCLIEDRGNGCCKVTWIVHMEHDETTVSQTYQPLLRSGQALGACRWLTSLQRECEYLAVMHSVRNSAAMTPNDGKMDIFEVAQRMTRSFYQAMCGPWRQPWRAVGDWSGGCGVGAERFEVAARVLTYPAGSGAPGASVLSATTPVWLPGVPAQQVFDYLCDGSRRGEWDSLADGAPILQEGFFATAPLPGNTVSVLRTTANGKLILQETCADTICMVLAYAIIDEQTMNHALSNGGAASLSLQPSGLVILPDGASPIPAACSSSTTVSYTSNSGSLVSVMYQTPLNGHALEEPSLEAIDNAGNLLCRVIRKIKEAVHTNSVIAA